jgi:hypothetical protein
MEELPASRSRTVTLGVATAAPDADASDAAHMAEAVGFLGGCWRLVGGGSLLLFASAGAALCLTLSPTFNQPNPTNQTNYC